MSKNNPPVSESRKLYDTFDHINHFASYQLSHHVSSKSAGNEPMVISTDPELVAVDETHWALRYISKDLSKLFHPADIPSAHMQDIFCLLQQEKTNYINLLNPGKKAYEKKFGPGSTKPVKTDTQHINEINRSCKFPYFTKASHLIDILDEYSLHDDIPALSAAIEERNKRTSQLLDQFSEALIEIPAITLSDEDNTLTVTDHIVTANNNSDVSLAYILFGAVLDKEEV